jgi:hypothetical protein
VTTAPRIDAGLSFPGTRFFDEPATPEAREAAREAATTEGLGPLRQLEGKWTGEGFNTIWRPNFPFEPQDRFLELNLTEESLEFIRIDGNIPNRGLAMPDIDMFGLTYMQQIQEKPTGEKPKGEKPKGDLLHVEPGIWARVPSTKDPVLGETVVRMGSIPHGTVILAQGSTSTQSRAPEIDDNNVIPFEIPKGTLKGTLPPPSSGFPPGGVKFPEVDLSTPTKFRKATPGVTQAMVTNPNSVLKEKIKGQTITSTTALTISTTPEPVLGGGTANTAFLSCTSNPTGGNANAVAVFATFWIETVKGDAGAPDFLQLQYTQTVHLDFNTLRWPHVTVATLRKQ